MGEPLAVFLPISARAPWGPVDVRWIEPSYLAVTIYNSVSRRTRAARHGARSSQLDESQFNAILTRLDSGEIDVTVMYMRECWRSNPPFGYTQPALDTVEIQRWKRRIAKWLRTWVAGRTSSAIVARAVAHHNAYVYARLAYPTVVASERPALERWMLNCAARARPAAARLLQLDRPRVREWVMLNYVPLIGRPARSLRLRDLNFDASPAERR